LEGAKRSPEKKIVELREIVREIVEESER